MGLVRTVKAGEVWVIDHPEGEIRIAVLEDPSANPHRLRIDITAPKSSRITQVDAANQLTK